MQRAGNGSVILWVAMAYLGVAVGARAEVQGDEGGVRAAAKEFLGACAAAMKRRCERCGRRMVISQTPQGKW